ncbi:hypothetical protein AKN40_1596 [Escherichia coli]|nr:hypothetical protein AKN40_1596 [Escherichia coli]
MFELKSPGCKVWAFVVLGHGKVGCARKKWLAIHKECGNEW